MGFLDFLIPKTKVYPVELTLQNFYPSVKNSPVPVIVNFYLCKSPACEIIYRTLIKFATDFQGRVRVGAFNVEQDVEGKILIPYKIRTIPTLLILYKGEPVKTLEGAIGYLKIQDAIEKIEAKIKK